MGSTLGQDVRDTCGQFEAMQALLEWRIAALKNGEDPGHERLLAGYHIEFPCDTRAFLERVHEANRLAVRQGR